MYHVMRRLLPAIGAAVLALALAGNAYAADKYVALGDSYSAGNGANSTNLNSSCNRNTYAYPYLVAQQRPNTALTFVACAGAQTGDILNNQVNSVTSDTKIVTMTIGGNDIGFTSLIIACTTLGCQSQINSSNSQIATPAAGEARRDVRGDQEPRAVGPGRHPRLRAAVRAPHVLRRHGGLALRGGSAQRADGQPEQHDQGARPGGGLHLRRSEPGVDRP